MRSPPLPAIEFHGISGPWRLWCSMIERLAGVWVEIHLHDGEQFEAEIIGHTRAGPLGEIHLTYYTTTDAGARGPRGQHPWSRVARIVVV